MKMYASIKFDREIDPSAHYISPGGYDMTFSGGLQICFDFMDYIGEIDTQDKSVLHCEMRNLDIDSFPSSKLLEDFSGEITDINEFYIYTGEYDDLQINLAEILSLNIINNLGEIIANKSLLTKVSKREWRDV